MHNVATNSSLVTLNSSPAAVGGDSSLTTASGAIAPLAVVRPYATRAVCSCVGDGHWRNPADRILEAYVKAWSLDNGLLYDVFELPPAGVTPSLAGELKKYRCIVSTIPIPGLANVRILGEGTEGTVMKEDEITALRKKFTAEIAELKVKEFR